MNFYISTGGDKDDCIDTQRLLDESEKPLWHAADLSGGHLDHTAFHFQLDKAGGKDQSEDSLDSQNILKLYFSKIGVDNFKYCKKFL